MNAAVKPQQLNGSFLPEINLISKKLRRRAAHYSRKKASLQTGSASDKSAQLVSRVEIGQLRNSLKQNICVKMLQEGYHRSFSELSFLLSSDRDRRAAAEPGSAVRLQTPLEEQQDKVETMSRHLSRAEQAERTGSWSVVCDQRLSLGRYFSAPEDLWLSLHFLHSCAERERGGRSRPATEARACLAELYLQQGELQRAKQQAELCIKQADDSGWLDSADRPLGLRGRRALWRIYSRLAGALLDAGDVSEALTLLHKGHSIAAETEDKQIEGEATYQLALTYQRAGDHSTAKQLFSSCMQICSTLQDADGQMKSYKAMIQSIHSEGNLDETVQRLEELVDVSCRNALQHHLVDAYMCLGNIYYKSSQYERAGDFFLLAYEHACDLGDVALLHKTQVLVASARARSLIRKYSADITAPSPDALRLLLSWKNSRAAAAAWS